MSRSDIINPSRLVNELFAQKMPSKETRRASCMATGTRALAKFGPGAEAARIAEVFAVLLFRSAIFASMPQFRAIMLREGRVSSMPLPFGSIIDASEHWIARFRGRRRPRVWRVRIQ